MSLEAKATEDLIRIAAAGGGFNINASGRSTEDLIRVAAAAGNKGARVSFIGMRSKSTEDLIRIGAAGKGAVVFED